MHSEFLPLVLDSDAHVWSSEGDLWPGSYDVDTANIKSERHRKQLASLSLLRASTKLM